MLFEHHLHVKVSEFAFVKHHNISEALGKLKMILLLLPPEETSHIQVLDIGVNKPFKTYLRELMIEEQHRLSDTEGKKKCKGIEGRNGMLYFYKLEVDFKRN
jgi:hypothetical protein